MLLVFSLFLSLHRLQQLLQLLDEEEGMRERSKARYSFICFLRLRSTAM
ncbi:unnamed protein product [Linum tenue]|uniref:Uncharacterized protein n=1 Tax=Linum tenue TaxID=586396 RepID=A0AAV0HNS8_9ROSI|nr:unnamed protein product [Linum tenue]